MGDLLPKSQSSHWSGKPKSSSGLGFRVCFFFRFRVKEGLGSLFRVKFLGLRDFATRTTHATRHPLCRDKSR